MTDITLSRNSAHHWLIIQEKINKYDRNDYIDVISSIVNDYVKNQNDQICVDTFMYLMNYLGIKCSKYFFDYPEAFNQDYVTRVKTCIENMKLYYNSPDHTAYLNNGMIIVNRLLSNN